MTKKVVVSGMLGGVVLVLWTFVVNGVFGFRTKIDMKSIPNERQIYQVLKENVVEPGRYICNPELTGDGQFTSEEPVYSVLYGGVGHEAAGGLMLVGLVVFFLAPVLAAWMLSQTSKKILSSYARKVCFFAVIGVLFALFSDLMNMGIGGYPLRDAVILGLHDIVAWIIVGLVVAWRIQPRQVVVLDE